MATHAGGIAIRRRYGRSSRRTCIRAASACRCHRRTQRCRRNIIRRGVVAAPNTAQTRLAQPRLSVSPPPMSTASLPELLHRHRHRMLTHPNHLRAGSSTSEQAACCQTAARTCLERDAGGAQCVPCRHTTARAAAAAAAAAAGTRLGYARQAACSLLSAWTELWHACAVNNIRAASSPATQNVPVHARFTACSCNDHRRHFNLDYAAALT